MRDLRELREEGLKERAEYVREQEEKEQRAASWSSRLENALEEVFAWLVEEMTSQAEEHVKTYFKTKQLTWNKAYNRGIGRSVEGPMFFKHQVHFYRYDFCIRFLNYRNVQRDSVFEVSEDKRTIYVCTSDYRKSRNQLKRMVKRSKILCQDPEIEIFFQQCVSQVDDDHMTCILKLGDLDKLD